MLEEHFADLTCILFQDIFLIRKPYQAITYIAQS